MGKWLFVVLKIAAALADQTLLHTIQRDDTMAKLDVAIGCWLK